MRICGLQKLAMVDYPGKLAATVFTGGCNLRCPFCHNAPLVTALAENPEVHSVEEVLSFLRSRKGFLDGMVLSGGEPLLTEESVDFLARVRELGYAIKLDTNGCFPETLNRILERGLVDYVAMDIKNSREKYGVTVGIPDFDLTPVEESIRLLRQSGVEYEFRTTLVREFHEPQDLVSIGQWLEGSPLYFLQSFVDSGNLIWQGLHGFTAEEMQGFAAMAAPYFGSVQLRGVD